MSVMLVCEVVPVAGGVKDAKYCQMEWNCRLWPGRWAGRLFAVACPSRQCVVDVSVLKKPRRPFVEMSAKRSVGRRREKIDAERGKRKKSCRKGLRASCVYVVVIVAVVRKVVAALVRAVSCRFPYVTLVIVVVLASGERARRGVEKTDRRMLSTEVARTMNKNEGKKTT